MVLSEKLTHFFGQNQNNTMFTTKRHVVCYKTTRRFEKVTRRISNCKPCRNNNREQYPERKKKMQGLALSKKKGAAKTSFATPPYFV